MDVVKDGAFEVDGGTADEIRAELATETVDAHAHGTPTGEPAADAVEEVDDDAEPVADAPAKAGEPKTAAAAQAQPKKKQTPAQRIGEMTAKMRGEERRRIAVERENADLKRRLEGGDGRRTGEESAQPAGEAAKFGGVPLTAEKYPSYAEMLGTNPDLEHEDYQDARQDWRSAKANAATQSEATTRAAKEGFERIATEFANRMAPHLEADPAFYETIDPMLTETPAASIYPPDHAARRKFYPVVVDIVQRSETPKELLEWLSADNSKELQRLKALRDPEAVYKAILRKELSIRPDGADSGTSSAELGGEAASNGGRPAQTSSQSAAAPPVKPVRGSSQQAVEIEATDDDSDDEWLRKEQARELAKVRRR